MPAPLAPGDVKSTNIPAALLEVALLLNAREALIPADTRPNNVTVAFDAETGTATISATLPIVLAVNAAGQAVTTATDYIP